MKSFPLEIVSLDGKIWDGDCFGVSVPTSKGEITILQNHAHLISDVVPGEIKIKVEKGKGIYSDDYIFLAVGRGLLEADFDKVSILSRSAERVDDIDEQEALKAKEKAKEILKKHQEGDASEVQFANATAQLERALAGLKVHKRKRGH